MYTIYGKPNCPYCDQAKALLILKNLEFEEHIIDIGQVKEEGKSYVTADQLRAIVPTARTVPQILLNEELIGGFEALKASLA